MSRRLPQDKRTELKQLANHGDMVAQAIVLMLQEVSMTPGALNTGVIHVKAQIVDGVGIPVQGVQDVLLTTKSIGTSAITITSGTAKLGNVSASVWVETLANGTFEMDVEDGTGGDLCLLEAKTVDGIGGFVALQF